MRAVMFNQSAQIFRAHFGWHHGAGVGNVLKYGTVREKVTVRYKNDLGVRQPVTDKISDSKGAAAPHNKVENNNIYSRF